MTEPPDPLDHPLLTSTQVAVLMNVDAKTVTRWAREGKLTAVDTPGGGKRFRRSDVLKFIIDGPER